MVKVNNRKKGKCSKRLMAAVMSFFFSICPLLSQINTDQVIFMGRSALASSDYLMAIHYFNQVIEAKPFLWQPYYFRAYTKFILDDYTGAEADCSKAIDANPYQVDVYQLRGLCRIRLEQYEKAVEDYTRTIAEKPQDEGALYNRGLCYLQMKQYALAQGDMNALLKYRPKFYRAYAIKAQISLAEKDTAQGLAFIDKLLTLNPENADGWSFKGRYALEQKLYAKADSCLSKAIKLQPNNFECYLARALARHGQNRFGAAIADYDKTIELVPQHFVAHYNRGLLLALVGNNNRAIEDFTFVIKKEPHNVLAIYNRALLRRETGDYRGAVADFTRIIQQFPNFTYGYFARAECRRKIGDIRGALNDETVVARANLDLNFGKSSRRYPIKKWRRTNDHSLDKYQELVDDADNDSTGSSYGRLLSADLFGRVQNKATDKVLLPPFIFTFNAPVTNKGYRSVAFIEQAAGMVQQLGETASLDFSTNRIHDLSIDEGGSERKLRSKKLKTVTDSLFFAAVVASDRYDYLAAKALLDKAAQSKQNTNAQFVIDMQRASVVYFGSLASRTSVSHPKSSRAIQEKNGMKVGEEKNKLEKMSLNAALTILNQVSATLKSRNQYVLYNQGCVYAAMGNVEQAIRLFSSALDVDKQFAEAYYNRGLLWAEQGEKIKARQDLSRAGELGLYKAYAILKQI